MRTHYCGNLNNSHLNQLVTLCGWIDSYRQLSKIIFINMRDWKGVVQIIFEKNNKNFEKAKKLKKEFCIQISGIVKSRNKNNVNTTICTGKIEILAIDLFIINQSITIPLDFKTCNTEEIILKYRYLELRKKKLLKNLQIRNQVTFFIHKFMNKNEFLNIETPILTKSTSEGARNYIIPSRIYPNKFYALPQSPQLFKQILMISGIDKYYQIAKCFRDEDLRSDRQPEFTQIDIEMAFTNENKIQKLIEKMVRSLWLHVKKIQLNKFPKMKYKDALKNYGTDKPDLRNPMKLFEIKDLLKKTQNNNFLKKIRSKKNRITALLIPSGNILKKSYIDAIKEKTEKKYGLYELLVIKLEKDKPQVSYNENFLTTKIINEIILRTSAKLGDIILIIFNTAKLVNNVFNEFRIKLGIKLKITNLNEYKPIWITDFPMFHKNEEGKLNCLHHPFTQPKNIKNIGDLTTKNIKNIISKSYDLVINGYEIGGGSIRIHDVNMQKKIFDLLNVSIQEQNQVFGYFIEALRYGSPIHGGIALGLDRIIMLLTNSIDIKDVIAFPKTTSAACPMTKTPSYIDQKFLKELSIITNFH